MRILGVLFLALFSSSVFSAKLELPDFIKSNKATVEKLLTKEFEYTFKVDYESMKCLEKKSEIGAVGVCMINASAIEESARITFSVTVTSHYEGTMQEEREISIKLVDYQL
ncbi:MAG: hypothetical protein Fur0010_22300 [Bdellovibrio sp.]